MLFRSLGFVEATTVGPLNSGTLAADVTPSAITPAFTSINTDRGFLFPGILVDDTLNVAGGIGATTLTVTGLSTFNGTTRFNTNTGYIQFDSANSYLYFRDNQQIVFGNGNNISMSWNGTSGSLSNAGDLLIRNNSVSGVTSIAGNTIGTIADFTQSGQVRVPGQLVVGAGASFAGVSTFTGIATHTATLFGTQLSISGTSTLPTIAGVTNFTNTTNSTATNNGALVISGGVGIANKIGRAHV